ncbi:MAG TPA: glycosyltransferase family 2 protein [Bacteroidales bacterium]|nr:glycosyltransferase family 2 protein [Bacteroidales bacterium]
MNKDIAVVILNYNGKRFLERFLADVVRFSPEADIVVADNASSDGSVDYLRQQHPEVHLLIHEKNFGYAGGYNQALNQLKHTYFVLLNSDIEVTEGWLTPLYAFMEQNQQVAACQPKLLSYADMAYFEYAGAGGGYIDKFGYPFCRGRIFQTIEPDEGQYDDVHEVFWASGACMFVRSVAFWNAGGFDADFFAHMEEIDLCWRMKHQGWKIMYVPQSKVYHIGGGTLPKISSRKTYLNFRNNLSMIYKNMPSSYFVYVIGSRLFLDVIASLKFLIEGGWGDFFAVWRAHAHFFRKLPWLQLKRNAIKPRKVSRIYGRNVVIDYFLLQKRYFSELNQRKIS